MNPFPQSVRIPARLPRCFLSPPAVVSGGRCSNTLFRSISMATLDPRIKFLNQVSVALFNRYLIVTFNSYILIVTFYSKQ